MLSKLDAEIQIFAGKMCQVRYFYNFFSFTKEGRIPGELRGLAAPLQWKRPSLLRRQFSSPFADYLSSGSVFTPKALCGRLPASICANLIREGALFVHDVALLSRYDDHPANRSAFMAQKDAFSTMRRPLSKFNTFSIAETAPLEPAAPPNENPGSAPVT